MPQCKDTHNAEKPIYSHLEIIFPSAVALEARQQTRDPRQCERYTQAEMATAQFDESGNIKATGKEAMPQVAEGLGAVNIKG